MTTLRRVQFATVLLHSAVLLWIVCRYIFVSNPGDYMMKLGDEWFFLFWADIPATAVLVFLDQVIPDSLDSALAELFRGHVHPFGNLGFWVPLLCYGIIGTWWWWTVPVIIAWIGKRVVKVYK